MSNLIPVEVTGEECSSRVMARTNAAQELKRELKQRRLIEVGDPVLRVHFGRPGRFYAKAYVLARLR